MRRVYADNAATTKMDDRVLEAMLPWLTDSFGNPSSPHGAGREAKRALESARRDILRLLGGDGELYFTCSGTEGNNWAITSALKLMKEQGKSHIISSAIEHHSVLLPLKKAEAMGFQVTYLRPNSLGILEPPDIERAIRPDTGFVSIMAANNELGTLQPIREIAEICRAGNILFHSDAVQAAGHTELDLGGIDMLTLSAHKFHGPKGIGGLYVKKGLKLSPILLGGRQEQSFRAGTENVAGAVAMARALELSGGTDILPLAKKLTEGVLEIPGTRLLGHRDKRLPGICNFCFEGKNAEELMLRLDLMGICVSSGAACTSGDRSPSHVLRAIGLTDRAAGSCIRFSLSRYNTEEDVEYILKALHEILGK